jgi:hypothetical protein
MLLQGSVEGGLGRGCSRQPRHPVPNHQFTDTLRYGPTPGGTMTDLHSLETPTGPVTALFQRLFLNLFLNLL